MVRDPFTASLEYRRRYIADRWWFLAGLLVVAGGVLVAWVSAAGWIVMILGVGALVIGLTRGVRAQSRCRFGASTWHTGFVVSRWAERLYWWRSPSPKAAGSAVRLAVWVAWLVALCVSASQGQIWLVVLSAAMLAYLSPDAWLN